MVTQQLSKRPQFGVEFVFLLDRVFQSFLHKLKEFEGRSDPIWKARQEARLRKFQQDELQLVFKLLTLGHAHELLLPSVLAFSPSNHPSTHAGLSSREEKRKSSSSNPGVAADPVTNPHPVPAWLIPSGKSRGDFFHGRSHPDNMKGFPQVPHHKDGRPKTVCIKFLSGGTCAAFCPRSHPEVDKLPPAVFKQINDRFKAIYQS